MFSLVLILVLLSESLAQRDLPTNYKYYTSSGVTSGLTTNHTNFLLNEIPIWIYSGSFHYFRNPRAYWKTRLEQIRAAGLNTVETYIPWNFHEYQYGIYDFGGGGSHMEDFLYIEEFLKLAQEEDLFVILRSGTYICSEFNFGGFPSWLLRETNMGFRTDESTYIKYVTRYFNVLLAILAKYQFTQGGPVIAFQVENEFGSVWYNEDFPPSKNNLRILRQLYMDNGIVELLVTSDPITSWDSGSLPGMFLQTINFGDSPEDHLKLLSELQPDKPLMVMEFWIGWFDYWTSQHQTKDPAKVRDFYERILKYPASVNIYMFQGGSNYGFNNGGALNNDQLDNSGYLPITTSYDFDSPLTESGNYTQKYWDVKALLNQYNSVKTFVPDPPAIPPTVAYSNIYISQQLKISDVITNQPPLVIESENLVAMEKLDINNNSGQSYGYIVYRKEHVDLESVTTLHIGGHVCDTVMVLVNGVLVSPTLNDLDGFGYVRLKDSTLILNTESVKNATIDLIVEEWGRMNGGTIMQYNQSFKGLWQGDVYLNENKVTNWKIIPLEFKKTWTNNLSSWSTTLTSTGPSLYFASLNLGSEPSDTYLDMRNWSKGLVIVNGFPIGKYFRPGPQQTLYIPAPFLVKGENTFIVFEHFNGDNQLKFVDAPIYESLDF